MLSKMKKSFAVLILALSVHGCGFTPLNYSSAIEFSADNNLPNDFKDKIFNISQLDNMTTSKVHIREYKFKKYNDASIEAFLKNEGQSLLKNVKSLSKVLYDNFQPMIPKLFRKLWKEGIDSNSYYLKLCGSGGGGYILGFTKDFEKAQTKLSSYQLDVIHRF